MAVDKTITEPPGPGVGQPPRDARSLDVLHIEIAKIQVDGDYTKKFLGELQDDMRDMRDRMAKLEVRVDHLPSKEFIVTVMSVGLAIGAALLTIAPKLQSWAGVTPSTVTAPAPPQPPAR